MKIVDPDGLIKTEKQETKEVHNPREKIILWLIVLFLILTLAAVIFMKG